MYYRISLSRPNTVYQKQKVMADSDYSSSSSPSLPLTLDPVVSTNTLPHYLAPSFFLKHPATFSRHIPPHLLRLPLLAFERTDKTTPPPVSLMCVISLHTPPRNRPVVEPVTRLYAGKASLPTLSPTAKDGRPHSHSNLAWEGDGGVGGWGGGKTLASSQR